MRGKFASGILCTTGSIVGAAVGIAIYRMLLTQSYHALVLPGAGLGLGCHLAASSRSVKRGVGVGVVALVVGVLTEWWFRPFQRDGSLSYFLSNLSHLATGTLLMIVVGGVFGFWWGREASPWLPTKSLAPPSS